MAITFSPGSSLIILFGVILAVVIILMIRRPGQTNQKLLSIVIMLVVFAVVYFMMGRPSEMLVDEDGIHSDAYGKINFSWSDVSEAEIIEDYTKTNWKPSIKINGVGMMNFKAGRYRLSNGSVARILTQQTDKAVVFITDEATYLIAVDEIDALIEKASEFIEF